MNRWSSVSDIRVHNIMCTSSSTYSDVSVLNDRLTCCECVTHFLCGEPLPVLKFPPPPLLLPPPPPPPENHSPHKHSSLKVRPVYFTEEEGEGKEEEEKRKRRRRRGRGEGKEENAALQVFLPFQISRTQNLLREFNIWFLKIQILRVLLSVYYYYTYYEYCCS